MVLIALVLFELKKTDKINIIVFIKFKLYPMNSTKMSWNTYCKIYLDLTRKVSLFNHDHLPFMTSRVNKIRKRHLIDCIQNLNENKIYLIILDCFSALNKKKNSSKIQNFETPFFFLLFCFAKSLTMSDLIKTKIGRFCRQQVKSTKQRDLHRALPTTCIFHL